MKTLNDFRKSHGGHDSHGHDSHGHDEEKAFVPYYVPMGRASGADMMECAGKKVPIHNTDIIRRGDFLWEQFDPSMRNGAFGAIYKSYLLAVFFFVATLVTAFFNVYIAAVCAYLAGHFWSERLFASAWGIVWFKGKNLTYTA